MRASSFTKSSLETVMTVRNARSSLFQGVSSDELGWLLVEFKRGLFVFTFLDESETDNVLIVGKPNTQLRNARVRDYLQSTKVGSRRRGEDVGPPA